MDGKTRINRILDRKDTDRSGFWLGNPHHTALECYLARSRCKDLFEFSAFLNDDLIWIMGEYAAYAKPGGLLWTETRGIDAVHTSTDGAMAKIRDVGEVDAYPWPDASYYDFTTLKPHFDFAAKHGKAVLSGMWSPSWHILHDLFGMENCLVNFYDAPDVMHRCMEKITDFYYAANKHLFDMWGKLIDVFFFGNDIGSQLDCIISPDMYKEFIFPYMKKLVVQAKSYGLRVALHSCGAISRVIPDIIGMGVDILHPIQAQASGMDALSLQEQFGGQIVFMGGLDTQRILPFASPDEIEAECSRLRKIFGKAYILSPSHEALLSNVPYENVLAMARGALKI